MKGSSWTWLQQWKCESSPAQIKIFTVEQSGVIDVKYQPWVYSLLVSLQDNIKGKQVKAAMILLFVLFGSYEICSDVMFPQRQILYFLYQSHQNHNLFSIFRYSRALYRDYTSLHPQTALPAPPAFLSWRPSLHLTHPSGQTSPGYSISLPFCPGVQL